MCFLAKWLVATQFYSQTGFTLTLLLMFFFYIVKQLEVVTFICLTKNKIRTSKAHLKAKADAIKKFTPSLGISYLGA
jgi:hypothetical protein